MNDKTGVGIWMPGIRPDWWIQQMCEQHQMISPFVTEKICRSNGRRIISYGLSSYGYDIRLADEFKTLSDRWFAIDPKYVSDGTFEELHGDDVWIPAGSWVLGSSIEYFKLPTDVIGVVVCKSTYIRCGVVVPTVVLEAGWEGHMTIQVCNNGRAPVRIYANEGIAQVLFFEGMLCEADYLMRGGKYQGQRGITAGIV